MTPEEIRKIRDNLTFAKCFGDALHAYWCEQVKSGRAPAEDISPGEVFGEGLAIFNRHFPEVKK